MPFLNDISNFAPVHHRVDIDGLQHGVQVLTRFLTSCPALYMYLAHLVQSGSRAGRAALAFCVCWAWLGLVLFPNFYPWT